MSGSRGNVAAVAAAGMLALAIAAAAFGPRHEDVMEPPGQPPPREVVVRTGVEVPAAPPPRAPELLAADAEADAVAPADWGRPDPLPDLEGSWCITTTTHAWGNPAALRARETWSAGQAAGQFGRTGRMGVEFDGVHWGWIEYEGELALSPKEACITHSSSTWIPSTGPEREAREADFVFAELNLLQHYDSEAFRAGACQPLVRIDPDTLTVRRADGFGHWLRCE